MFRRHSLLDSGRPLSEEVLDEIEGEALVVVEHPARYPALTVAAAKRALETVQRLRRPGLMATLPQSA